MYELCECVRERDRERMCVYVYQTERDRERERVCVWERERERGTLIVAEHFFTFFYHLCTASVWNSWTYSIPTFEHKIHPNKSKTFRSKTVLMEPILSHMSSLTITMKSLENKVSLKGWRVHLFLKLNVWFHMLWWEMLTVAFCSYLFWLKLLFLSIIFTQKNV